MSTPEREQAALVARPCPGCGIERGGNVCCDACWKRVPTRIPGVEHQPWRTRLRTARQIGAWDWIEDVHDAVRAWLLTHPKPRQGADRV